MGQGTPAGCSFGTSMQICSSERAIAMQACSVPDPRSSTGGCEGRGLVMPRCGVRGDNGASSSSRRHNAAGLSQAFSSDLAHCRYPGSSCLSSAFKATHQATGEVRVIRILMRRRCEHERDRLMRELEALQQLQHPNLARICEVVEDPRALCLVMELASGEDLLSAVARVRHQLSESYVASLMRQLLHGLQHLHSANLAHEDVCPRNILAAEEPSYGDDKVLRLKLIDYGLAAKYAKGNPSALLKCCNCLAPEQVGGSFSPQTVVMKPACDLWAVGVITYVLLSGHWPFEAETQQLTRKRIKEGRYAFEPIESWASISEAPKAFVRSLLAVDSAQHLRAAQVLDHDFLRIDAIDKHAMQPLARHEQIADSLRQISARWMLQHLVVDTLAIRLSIGQFPELRKHLESVDSSSRGLITLSELRRGLVQAGVALPGRLLEPILTVESDDWRYFSCEELVEAAVERRRGLEEAMLWAAWAGGASESTAFLGNEDVLKVLQSGGTSLIQVFGMEAVATAKQVLQSARWCSAQQGHATVKQFPEQVSFEQLLSRMRELQSTRPLRVVGSRPSMEDLMVKM